jgi:hypothetical protein
MVLNTLESLVLRNLNAANNGLTVAMLRRGPGYQHDSQTPEIPISQRHPSQGAGHGFMPPAERPEDAIQRDGVVDAVSGTGRFRRLTGVLCRRSAAKCAAKVVLSKRLGANGGTALPVTTRLCRIVSARQLVAGSKANSGRLSAVRTTSFTAVDGPIPVAGRLNETTVGVAWQKPATWTPPASTRGEGVQ